MQTAIRWSSIASPIERRKAHHDKSAFIIGQFLANGLVLRLRLKRKRATGTGRPQQGQIHNSFR